MESRPRSKPPAPWFLADLAARFAALDHLHALGLVSESVVHALFEPIGWCCCTRCQFTDTESAR